MDEIQQYLSQISQVEKALINSKDDEREKLISLKNDLNELLKLTKETQLQLLNKNKSNIDDEFSLFMAEVNELENTTTTSSKSKSEVDIFNPTQNINEEEEQIVGKKCSAPHTHLWGSKTYHNALICEIENNSDDDDDNDNKDEMVRVLYTNPTHQEMIPCGYYLDGHCKFNADKCRFSHGALVRVCDIKPYKAPDFTMLNQPNCLVLVKHDDNLWHKGTVKFVDFDKKRCKVKLEQKKLEIESDFEYVFPLINNLEYDSDLSSNDDDNDHDDNDNNINYNEIRLIEQSLLTPAPDQMLGKWEKYTKGFGSKLMYKMGYVTGTGLGKCGEGIIVPVSAQVLPQGRSLDYCMNLREQSNGDKNLFNVEKKLQKAQKKQEKTNIKAYEREKNKTDLFSFINTQVFNKTTLDDPHENQQQQNQQQKNQIKKIDLKSQTTKNLNVASFEISENIRKKEKEIQLLNQSLKRHKVGTPVFVSIQTKLNINKNELNNLRNSEKTITKEQNVRSNNKTIF